MNQVFRFSKKLCRLVVAVLGVGAIQAAAALPVQTWTSASGARVQFIASPAVPMLDINLDVDAGDRLDPPGKDGVATLTAALLDAGVGASGGQPALEEAQVADRFADVGAIYGATVGPDRTSIRLRTLADPAARDPAVALLARLLAAPIFDPQALARERDRTVAAIRESLTQPDAIAEHALLPAAFGAHPYGAVATEASVAALTRDDLAAFHAAHYTARSAVVTIVGAISADDAKRIADLLTAALPPGDDRFAQLAPVVRPSAPQTIRIAHPAQQAHLLLGQPAIARDDADYFAFLVGNYILGGGGFASRLMNEVREKRGLAYSVSSTFSASLQPGLFRIGLQTQKDQADTALALVHSTLDRFWREGPTPKELRDAKANLVNGFPLRLDSNHKLLDYLALIGWYRLPADYLETWTKKVAAVGAADVKRAFARHLDPATMVTVVVGGVAR